MKKTLPGVSRLLPCSVTLLTVGVKGKQDAMTAAAMFVSENPPLLTVSVAKHIVSHDLIEQAGEFVVNVASSKQVKLARQLGFTHGREMDKFKRFGLRKEKAKKVAAPLIKGSYASIECKVITALSAAKYVVYLAEVVACTVDEKQVPLAWHRNKYFSLTQEAR
jgi:flavin reductase (DIM6/NTAB) family NADH-FMN oxidoreductase RutF